MLSVLILVLRRVLGALLVGVGLIVGVVGLSASVVLGWLWARGQTTAAGDGRAAVAGIFLTLVGAAGLWAGGRVWPGRWSSAGPGALTPASRRPRHPAWIAAGLLAVAGPLLYAWAAAAPLSARIGFVLLGLAVVFLGLHLVIAVHEFGHLAVAALLGRDLQLLQVGAGRLLLGLDLSRGLRVEWRLWPASGLVHAADGRVEGWHRRMGLFVAAGPLAHAGLLAVLALVLYRANGGRLLPAGDAVDAGAALRVGGTLLLWAGATWLLSALIPQVVRIEAQAYLSDGGWLPRLRRMDAQAVETAVIVGVLARVDRLWAAGQRGAARARLTEVLTRFPARPVLAVAEGIYLLRGGGPQAAAENFAARAGEGRAAGWPFLVRLRLVMEEARARAEADQPERARAVCEEFLAGVTAPAERAEALDTCACLVTHFGARALLAPADAWSAEMLALEPEVHTRQSTRGAVLVELGRFEEAAPVLEAVWERSAREVDAASAAFGLARVARARGDLPGLRRWRRRARRFAAFTSDALAARIAGPELEDPASCGAREAASGEATTAPAALPSATLPA